MGEDRSAVYASGSTLAPLRLHPERLREPPERFRMLQKSFRRFWKRFGRSENRSGCSKSLSGASGSVLGAPEIVPDAPETVPDAPKVFPEVPEAFWMLRKSFRKLRKRFGRSRRDFGSSGRGSGGSGSVLESPRASPRDPGKRCQALGAAGVRAPARGGPLRHPVRRHRAGQHDEAALEELPGDVRRKLGASGEDVEPVVHTVGVAAVDSARE